MKQKQKGFTLIELIVIMAIIAILVLIAAPKFMGYTEKAKLTKVLNNLKAAETAAELYYMDNDGWPKQPTEYTAAQLNTWVEEFKSISGDSVVLESGGKYYDVDWNLIKGYMEKPDNDFKYIIQNPVGDVYYASKLTTAGEQTKFAGNNQESVVVPSKVGQQLLTPEVGWQRIEDNDSRISYVGGPWTYGANVICYGGSENFSRFEGASINFKFSGTKLRLIDAFDTVRYPNVLVTIDGVQESYSTKGETTLGQRLVYEKLGLANTVHTVTITHPEYVSNPITYIALDAIDIDVNGSLIP